MAAAARKTAALKRANLARIQATSSISSRSENFSDLFPLPRVAASEALIPVAGWLQGPKDPAGSAVADLSDRPLLCSSRDPRPGSSEVVFGGADHALYGVDAASGRPTRRLYGKQQRSGHTEWVTAVAHLPGGEVVSAAMDGRLVLWPQHHSNRPRPANSSQDSEGGGLSARRTSSASGLSSSPCRGIVLAAHEGSITQLRVCGDRTVATAGFDGAVRLWNVTGGAAIRERAAMLSNGPADSAVPVMDFSWVGGRLLAGSRDGCAQWWDLSASEMVGRRFRVHKGHVTVVHALNDDGSSNGGSFIDTVSNRASALATGGQDGFVRLWDPRCVAGRNAAALEVPAHVSPRGRGAVGGLTSVGGGAMLLSYGADGRACLLDLRAAGGSAAGGGGDSSRAVLHTFEGHRSGFIYSMACVGGGIVATGGGDGMVLFHEVQSGRLLYGLGCCEGAVRCLEAGEDWLAVGGDDGNVVLYRYS